jgi:Arv1-like family
MKRFLTTSVSSEISATKYRCVTCLHPCESLYCEYGYNANPTVGITRSSKTLKLNRCVMCHQTADPYCEREWLLIVLDLILLRQEAYRHVLFNENWMHENLMDMKNCFKYIVVCCIEPVFHHWQSYNPPSRKNEKIDEISFNLPVGLIHGFSRSVLGLFVFVSTVLILSIFIAIKDNSNQMIRMILKSVVWPLFGCQVATCFVAIWDSSAVTRILGCIVLPFTYQWMALYQILLMACIRNYTYSNQTNPEFFLRILKTSFVLMTAFFAKIIIAALLITSTSKNQNEICCGGMEWSLRLGPTISYRICFF